MFLSPVAVVAPSSVESHRGGLAYRNETDENVDVFVLGAALALMVTTAAGSASLPPSVDRGFNIQTNNPPRQSRRHPRRSRSPNNSDPEKISNQLPSSQAKEGAFARSRNVGRRILEVQC